MTLTAWPTCRYCGVVLSSEGCYLCENTGESRTCTHCGGSGEVYYCGNLFCQGRHTPGAKR